MPDENTFSDDANQLKVLIHKRGQCKAKLTRFQTYLDSQSTTLNEVKLRLGKLESTFNEFENIQTQIELLNLDDSSQSDERDSFESLFFSISSKAETIIQDQSSKSQPSSINNSSSDSHSPNSTPQIPVKLPSIDMPSFTGRYEDWITFSETFNALVHENSSLSEIHKFHYLKSALKGEAALVLESLELSANNYSVARNILQKRYQNKRIIVQTHVNAIFDLPAADKETASGLRPLLDGVLRHVRALKALDLDTDGWDPLLLRIITGKLNPKLLREWELSTKPDTLPTFNQLTDFLQQRCQMLETTSMQSATVPKQNSSSFSTWPRTTKQKTFMAIQSHSNCRICNGKHPIYYCQVLLKSPEAERYQKLTKAGVCFNCLKPGHDVSKCNSVKGCKFCSRKHNTILHTADHKPSFGQPTNNGGSTATKPHEGTKTLLSSNAVGLTQGILNTAVVQVTGPTGRAIKCRALLDNGSECCYITENIAQQLGLKKVKHSIQVSGVNQTVQNVNATTSATIASCVTNFKTKLQFLIIPKITGRIPSEQIDVSNFKIPNHVILADPSFGKPNKVDLLIGQELFWDLICIGQIKTPGMPTLQKTKLGWLVGGTVQNNNSTGNSSTTCHLTTLDKQLQKFWTLEEPPQKHHLTADEIQCEEHYKANTRRNADGRYIVKMPLRAETTQLGESRDIAKKRFAQLERRFERDPSLKETYSNFIAEYFHLGHMELVTEDHAKNQSPEYFIPHHPILKSSSTTTKLRVVFDASAKTSSGESLNSLQLIGPTVQTDICSIIARFRMHTYVMTADIEKMYRQILIDESQQDLLKIFWRNAKNEPLQVYRLKTVTYGTASAPYLATRTLNQLSMDEESNFKEAASVVRNDFYMDDLLTGTDTYEKASKLQCQLIDMLSKGGFHLRKWNSNCSELLYNLPEQMRERHPQQFPTDDDSSIKTLGLWWDAEKDIFNFKYSPNVRKHPIQLSKRIVLSDIARLFDPLGLVAPIIVRPKLLLQELWKLKLEWDESLPMHLHTQWLLIQRCLESLGEIKIPRQVTLPTSDGILEIHGFADASERAYGGVVYLRHEDTEGNVKVSLLCSKSKVAPLHSTSLPRLELCAALLLTELVSQIQCALKISSDNTTYWTDSTIAIAWIRAEPARWTTFVANRVAKIQEASKGSTWRHVSTQCNPADLVSRGETANNLSTSQLWWHGPAWLNQAQTHWPNNVISDENVPEQRKSTTSLLISTKQTSHICQDLLDRISSLDKINRVLAYCQRFIVNTSPKHQSRSGPLSVSEILTAEKTLVKYVQGTSFSAEIRHMAQGKAVPSESKLMSLDPFFDNDGLIRVGGRLQQSQLSYDHKHQMLLPKNHKLCDLIARREHIRNLQCGPNALLCTIREQYWPINGRDLVRKITHQCVQCFRARPKTLQQKMGDLPAARVTPTRPFVHTGVDFGGPFHVKQSKRRGTGTAKAYVAVFVCLATKAVHIELVSDLTTASFLAAMRRFISRRGMCTKIFSDNGKTFVGAKREIKELQEFFNREAPEISNMPNREGIEWSFIPPYAPHMGGLWEAAVKSLKHHLYRIVGNASLSFEELTTILTQVEAVLNSRPITPLSNDPSDLCALTPAHFLTGGSLMVLPEPSLMQFPENRLSRWQRVQQLTQHFWNRWSKDYLTSLQQRKKWKVPQPAIAEGSLVLLKEDHSPPLSWPLGRVIHLHPGKDGLTRVVTIKTLSGEVKRCVKKLCPLPIDN